MSQTLTIGLVAHIEKRGAAELVAALRREFLKRRGEVTLLIEHRTAQLVGQHSNYTVSELGMQCDLLIVLGGDGTILSTLHALGRKIPPIVGINLGNLGFLTCLSSSDYKHAVDCILARDYQISYRSLLEAEIIYWGSSAQPRGRTKPAVEGTPKEKVIPYFALNDAVISRGNISRMIRLETWVDGVLLTNHHADGLIIATPTGSTAYSMSAGGPILAPESGVFVITPICPHVLSSRSVIVNNTSCIEVWINENYDDILLTLDGQKQIPLKTGDCLRLNRAPVDLPLVTLPDLPFFEIARRKLKWGGTT